MMKEFMVMFTDKGHPTPPLFFQTKEDAEYYCKNMMNDCPSCCKGDIYKIKKVTEFYVKKETVFNNLD